MRSHLPEAILRILNQFHQESHLKLEALKQKTTKMEKFQNVLLIQGEIPLVTLQKATAKKNTRRKSFISVRLHGHTKFQFDQKNITQTTVFNVHHSLDLT